MTAEVSSFRTCWPALAVISSVTIFLIPTDGFEADALGDGLWLTNHRPPMCLPFLMRKGIDVIVDLEGRGGESVGEVLQDKYFLPHVKLLRYTVKDDDDVEVSDGSNVLSGMRY